MNTLILTFLLFVSSVINASDKIINGGTAKNGEFPYVVSLRIQNGGTHICGGSILNEKWILTAAQCCESVYDTYVFANSLNLNGTGDSLNITRKIAHPAYNNFNLDNDICLMSLENSIRFGIQAQPVNLPSASATAPTNTSALIAGWGNIDMPGWPSPPNELQILNYKTLSNCGDNHICAIPSSSQGMCQGDIGGPLMVGDVQIGISSIYVTPCATNNSDIYVNVAQYVSWIQSTINFF